MAHLKSFANRQAAMGKKIPSPCVIKYDDFSVDYFRPAGKVIVDEERYTIKNGTNGLYAE
jgi:hypothetical protein